MDYQKLYFNILEEIDKLIDKDLRTATEVRKLIERAKKKLEVENAN